MAEYQCPLQNNIDSLQATADKLKQKACRELFNKGYSIYYYGTNKQVAINGEKLQGVFHHFIPALAQLNYSKNIITFCQQNMEEDDYVVF